MATLLSATFGAISIESATAVSPAAVNLGSASSFAVLAGTYTTTGAPSTFNGNIAASAAITTGASNTIVGSTYSGAATTTGASSSISGNIYSGAAITLGASSSISGIAYSVGAVTFGAGATVSESKYPNAEPQYTDATTLYTSAISAMNTAITDINNRTGTAISGTLGGVTLTPGVYSSVASLGLTGALTLDAQGDPNAIFIIKSASFLVTAASSSVVLVNQAQAKNVFWAPTGYFTAGADSIFKGNVLATEYVSIGARTAIEGRLFSRLYVNFGIGNGDSVFGITGIGTTDISTSGTAPSALGLTQSAANTSLTNAGFTLGTVTTTASGATVSNDGQVKTQSATGANQLFATPIDVVLYAYVAPATSGTAPSVLGLTEAAARSALIAAGFTTGTVTTTTVGATDDNTGQVVTQSATGVNQPFATPINFVIYLDLTPPNTGTAPPVLEANRELEIPIVTQVLNSVDVLPKSSPALDLIYENLAPTQMMEGTLRTVSLAMGADVLAKYISLNATLDVAEITQATLIKTDWVVTRANEYISNFQNLFSIDFVTSAFSSQVSAINNGIQDAVFDLMHQVTMPPNHYLAKI